MNKISIINFDTIESTSKTGTKLVQEGKELPFAICANKQSAGKGCYGRSWQSPVGNIYISYFLKHESKFPLCLTPIKTGVILASWIQKTFNIRVTLKWPNDLLFSQKKMGGILCESQVKGTETCYIALGLGINIKTKPKM